MLTARKYSSVSTQLWGIGFQKNKENRRLTIKHFFLSVFSVTWEVTRMSQNIEKKTETLKIDN